MTKKLTLPLATSLMMFPQVAETIYSPALPGISRAFSVTAEQAAQTLSLYFLAFALGVVVWGRLCDRLGRRPTMLAGLSVYAAASLMALLSPDFGILLAARILAAFGAAVGSIGTQTMLRDSYHGAELASAFAVIGVALGVGPAIGIGSGVILVTHFGHQGVFAGLAVLAMALLLWSSLTLPESRPDSAAIAPLWPTLCTMARDRGIWRDALLIALFNLCLFSYYQLAPFEFERLGWSTTLFGYSGLVLSVAVVLGSQLSRRLLGRGWHSHRLVLLAAVLALLGSVGVAAMASQRGFLLPMLLVVLAYALAIPNILATALAAYQDRAGTAGALLGLLYYLQLGLGLVAAARLQHLGLVLLCSAAGALLLATLKARRAAM
ncbi:Bcr/CflA family efflux MFS transporter [Zobellella sp. DQSA1]|uniref:Bcr/CflA family efflux MFS transporter n=1 Tax=Zobellella sp. DQSA1 TaxID=3342386 RepID=UPI0035C262AB